MPEVAARKVIEVRFASVAELEQTYREQISKGGYFVPTDQPHPRTTPVLIRFSLPGLPQPFAVEAEVAFAAAPDAPIPGLGAGMAIQFAHLTQQINKVFQAAITVAKAEGLGPAPAAPEAPAHEDGPIAMEGEEAGPEPTGEEPAEADEEIDEALVEDENVAKDVMVMLSQQSDNLYAIVRKLPLHKKIVAAKRGNRNVRAILLQEGHKKVMLFLLQNPQIGAAEVIQMLKLPSLSIETIQHLSRNPVFIQNEEIKYLVVINSKTPLPLALTLLNTLNLNHLAKIAKSQMKAQLKSTALRLLEQRRK